MGAWIESVLTIGKEGRRVRVDGIYSWTHTATPVLSEEYRAEARQLLQEQLEATGFENPKVKDKD